jgi:hypothetical protein
MPDGTRSIDGVTCHETTALHRVKDEHGQPARARTKGPSVTTHTDTIPATDPPRTTDDTVPMPFDLEPAFGWEGGPDPADPGDRDTVFRFPTADDPEPPTRRLLGMSLYASVLGLLGLAVAIRGIAAIVGGRTPGWYEPVLAVAGLAGVALVVAAFLSIHRRLLPWLLLLAAAVPLTANLLATAYAV